MYRYRISYCLVASFDAVSNNIPNSCNLNVRLVFMLLWMRWQFGNLSWNIRACDVCLCVCMWQAYNTNFNFEIWTLENLPSTIHWFNSNNELIVYRALCIDTHAMKILRLRPLCIPVICLFFDDFHNTHAWGWYYFWKETHTHFNFNRSKSKRMSTWISLIKYFPIPYMYQCTIFHCICGNRIDTSTKAAF